MEVIALLAKAMSFIEVGQKAAMLAQKAIDAGRAAGPYIQISIRAWKGEATPEDIAMVNADWERFGEAIQGPVQPPPAPGG